MGDERGRKRNRDTPPGGPQVVHTLNATFHSYSARVKADGAFEWTKPHGWIKKVRDTDILRIQAVRANMKLTHEYLINPRNNQIGMDLYLRNAAGSGDWQLFRTKLELSPGNYPTRSDAEEAATRSFLKAFENVLNRANTSNGGSSGVFNKYDDTYGTPFDDTRTGAIRAEIAMAEGRTTRFTYQENTAERHLTYEHRIRLENGNNSRYRNKILTEQDFPDIMDRTGAVQVDWVGTSPNQKTDRQADRNGPTNRLLFLVDVVTNNTALASVDEMRLEFVSLNDTPQSVQVWGARFNRDIPGFDGDAVGPLTIDRIPNAFNRGSLSVTRSVKASGQNIFTFLGHSPNRFFLKPDHHYYLRIEDISNPNLETPFLTEGHSTDVIGQSTPSTILAQLNVKESGDFATFDQRSDSGPAHSSGFFILPSTYAIERIKIQIVDEAGTVILPNGNQQIEKGVIPLDLMLRFDVIRQPDNERSANAQVQSETTATDFHRWTIPGTVDNPDSLKTQRIM